MVTKDRDIIIEQSLCTEYSKRAITHACRLEILQLIFTDTQQKIENFKQNIEQNRQDIKELLERKIGGKKQNRLMHNNLLL